MIKQLTLALSAMLALATAGSAFAADVSHSTVGAGGYDLVSYHEGEKPVRGNGNHLVVHEGVTYLFQNEDTKRKFAKRPERYVPAFGGFCAYGVAVGKKFVGDPDVYELVDGRLYLNLDNKIKGLWTKDVPGNIKKAEANWSRIQSVPAAEL